MSRMKAAFERLRFLCALRPPGRRLVVEAAVCMEGTRLVVHLVPLKHLKAVPALFGGRLFRGEPHEVEDVVRALDLAGSLFPGGKTCLVRAIAAQAMLSRHGHPSLVRIGVAGSNSGGIEAHAWVEYGGRAIVGGYDLERYRVITSLPAG